MPVVARLTGGTAISVHVTRFAFQAMLLVCLLLAAERVCGDRVTALGLALAVAATQIGTEVWRDSCLWFDNCAHALLALALVAQRPAVVAGACLLGAFVDERTLLVLPLIMLFAHATGASRTHQWWLVAVGPTYVAIRSGLSLYFGMANPIGEIGTVGVLVPNLANLPAAFWFALEGGWIFVATAIWLGTRPTRHGAVWLALGTLGPLAAGAGVGDFTRSVAYVFPATFAAVACLRKFRQEWDQARWRTLAGSAAVVSLFTPNGVIIGNALHFESSLPVRALQEWLRMRS